MLENHIIDKCKAGDGEAFRQLMKIYKNKLYGYLWRFSDSQYMAEELFQETLIKVWKGIKRYNEQKKFSSWLFTIAHNVAMDKLRSSKNNKVISNIDDFENIPSHVNPDEEIIKKETINQINKFISHLSEKQKSVFLLRQHGELSFKEIAEVTKEPLNTVLSHMRYAVKKIKKQLENENEPRKISIS